MTKTTILLCLVVALFLVSCQKAPQSMQIFTEEYPPISFAVNDSISGYATDVVRALQAKLGSTDKITLTNWNEAYDKALKEANVILFSMEQTPQRKDLFNWIGPLGENVASFYVKKDSPITLASPEDAKKLKNIATTSAWFTEQFLKDNGFTNLISSEQPMDNIKQVMDGTADATILTNMTAGEIIKNAGFAVEDLKPVLEVMRTKYYIAISKQTDAKTLAKWEKAFSEISADGTLDKIRSNWFK